MAGKVETDVAAKNVYVVLAFLIKKYRVTALSGTAAVVGSCALAAIFQAIQEARAASEGFKGMRVLLFLLVVLFQLVGHKHIRRVCTCVLSMCTYQRIVHCSSSKYTPVVQLLTRTNPKSRVVEYGDGDQECQINGSERAKITLHYGLQTQSGVFFVITSRYVWLISLFLQNIQKAFPLL